MGTKLAKNRLMEQRWNALDKAMEANGLDVVLIYGKGIISQYGYLYYYGGFFPVLRPGFIVYARGREPIANYSTQAECFLAKEKGTIEDVRFVGTGADVLQAGQNLMDEIVQQIHAYNPKKVGIVGLRSLMSVSQFEYFTREIKAETIDATTIADQLKLIKFKEELDGVRQAFALADKAFAAFKDAIRPGRTCAEIAGDIEQVARGGGAIDTLIFVEEGPYFLRKPTSTPISGAGVITAYVELIDENGYWVEKAGLFTIGDVADEAMVIGEACVAAMEEVKRTIRPGATVGEVAAAIHKHSDHLDVRMGLWHGHGVGIDHDMPIIADNGTDVLKEDMVISVHPNFSDANEKYGASIADLYIVTADGAESLTQFSYDIVKL